MSFNRWAEFVHRVKSDRAAKLLSCSHARTVHDVQLACTAAVDSACAETIALRVRQRMWRSRYASGRQASLLRRKISAVFTAWADDFICARRRKRLLASRAAMRFVHSRRSRLTACLLCWCDMARDAKRDQLDSAWMQRFRKNRLLRAVVAAVFCRWKQVRISNLEAHRVLKTCSAMELRRLFLRHFEAGGV